MVCYDLFMIFTPLGEYLYPDVKAGSCSMIQNTSDYNLVYEGVLFYDDFNNDNNWNLNDNWHIENGYLISRSQDDSFYSNNLYNNSITSNQINNYGDGITTGDGYLIESKLKYELEWDQDYFSSNIFSDEFYNFEQILLNVIQFSLNSIKFQVNSSKTSLFFNNSH